MAARNRIKSENNKTESNAQGLIEPYISIDSEAGLNIQTLERPEAGRTIYIKDLLNTKNDDSLRIKAALNLMGALDRKSLDALCEIIKLKSGESKELKLAALASLKGTTDYRAAVCLYNLIHNEKFDNSVIKKACAMALRGTRHVDILSGLCDDLENPNLVRFAEIALSGTKDKLALRVIRERGFVYYKTAAIKLLGTTEDPATLLWLRTKGIEGKNASDCASALALSKDPETIKFICDEKMKDPDQNVRLRYINAVNPNVKKGMSALEEAANDPVEAVRMRAVSLLVFAGWEVESANLQNYMGVMTKVCDHKDPEIRAKALEGFWQLAPKYKAAVQVIEKKLSDENKDVSIAALKTLTQAKIEDISPGALLKICDMWRINPVASKSILTHTNDVDVMDRLISMAEKHTKWKKMGLSVMGSVVASVRAGKFALDVLNSHTNENVRKLYQD
jgi:HEAT repeat protein